MPTTTPSQDNNAQSDASAVREQLQGILDAHAFKASKRLRRLLAYLVRAALDGRQRELTQRHLATEIFERNDFDPERDAVVRVEMRKLRQALELYYSGAGSADPVRISIPSGSYVPEFVTLVSSAGGDPDRTPDQRAQPRNVFVGVAVLPFTDRGPIAGNDWLAHGISEELSTLLGRIPEIHLTPAYLFPENSDVNEQLQRLRASAQVRFVIEGSTRIEAEKLRATVRLHDLANGRQIWSGRYDRDLEGERLVPVQEGIAHDIVGEALDMFTGALGRSLRAELTPESGQHADLSEAFIRFHQYLHTTTAQAYRSARLALESVSRREPKNALVLSMLADLRRAGYSLAFTDEPDRLPQVLAMLDEALALAPDCLPCRVSLSFALLQVRDKDALLEQVELVTSEPTSPESYRADIGVPLALSGEWQRGCELITNQMKENRHCPHYFQYPLFLNNYRQTDYAQAATIADRFRPAEFFWQPMLHAAALGKLGRLDAAKKQVRRLRSQHSSIEANGRRTLRCYLMEDELVEDLTDGLRRAGLRLK